jgi:transcription initiation factor TFIIA large subunit
MANPAPPQVHSQAQFSPQLNLPSGNSAQSNSSGIQNGIKQEQHATPVYPPSNGPTIKQEPGTQSDNAAYMAAQGYPDQAASRAAQHISARFGTQAQGSINALQQGGLHHQQPQQPETAQRPPPPAHPTPARTQEEYRQQMAANTAAQQHSHLGNGQTDGAGESDEDDADDFEGVLMRRSEAGELQELGRVEIDQLMHRHIAARAKAMEGGGLMVPLREATQHRTDANFNRVDSSSKRRQKIAGYDGGDDEEDEDAINSDLDDSEDDEGDPEADDEGLGHIMLCMYDKVQRVKNKWYVALQLSRSS